MRCVGGEKVSDGDKANHALALRTLKVYYKFSNCPGLTSSPQLSFVILCHLCLLLAFQHLVNDGKKTFDATLQAVVAQVYAEMHTSC